ncbi:hypothetical protein BGX28_000280 [Mortierella sp. GBA30]|nr:hypothetical protein BGX28_000280 [Mortierella sp. GBA30]
MLPTEEQLRGTAHHQNIQRPKNSLLSSWLSNASSGSNAKITADNNTSNNGSPRDDADIDRNTIVDSRAYIAHPPLHTHHVVQVNDFDAREHGTHRDNMEIEHHHHHHNRHYHHGHHQYYPPYSPQQQGHFHHYHQDPHTQFFDNAASPTNATIPTAESNVPAVAPEKAKRGRKPKPKPESEEADASGTKTTPKEKKKPKTPKEPKAPKEPKEPKPKKIKEPKPPKEPKQKKSKVSHDVGSGAVTSGGKTERSILSFFDRSVVGPSSKSNVITGEAFKQSCLSFDVLDPSKVGSYFSTMAAEDERRHGSFMKELPKLTGRAPYEDLMSALLLRSSRLPTLNKLDLHHPELDMDMLADVKMVHEFLNTFGTSFGLTKDSGEWITFDLLLSMIRNPRIDERLLDLNCKMIMAAYEEEHAPKINRFNFPYFLAAGPEAMSTLEEKRADKKKNKSKHASTSASTSSSRKKAAPLNRLGTIEYSGYTIADRIEALVKALHDITSSPRFHRFMRDEVEENITTLKRQKRKRTEVRKELESQTHELEREMKAIERRAAELETQRQAILASERENYDGPGEDETSGGRITASSRLQRLAQSKGARSKVNEILNQQKALVAELKAKETAWEAKKEELDDISLDDTEIQKDNNVPWTRLRGGYVVNTDEKLRVICLGSDRWGRKYWFWKNFGGVIIEDRGQVGPKWDEETNPATLGALFNTGTNDGNGLNVSMEDTDLKTTKEDDKDKDMSAADESLNDVTMRMKTLAHPELAGNKPSTTKDRMSIANLLSEPSPSDQESFTETQMATPPEKDLLDYGQIQTWSLISTSKELASLTRALNGKGTRERVLKASLTTMRKEIEASFDRIKAWAGGEYGAKNPQTVSVLGAVGQPLTQEELMLLMKKKGRKSKQELADIAATRQELVAVMGAVEENEMEVDGSNPAEPGPSSAHQDSEMMDECSEHSPLQPCENDEEKREESGFLASVLEDSTSGPTPFEFFESIIQATEERLEELSRTICNGDGHALLKAAREARDLVGFQQDDQLVATINVLNYCLKAMEERPSSEEMEMVDGENAMDVVKESGATNSLSVPVSVNPRLLAWLRTCRIDTMLQDVKTFGALHAWLDECIGAVASVVYDTDEDDESEEDVDGVREKDEEDEEAEDHVQDDEDDEGEDGDENDHEDDGGDEAGDDKAQEDDQQDEEDDDEEEHRHGRQRKARQEPELKFSNIRGRALRARGGKPVSYKTDSIQEEDEDDNDDDGEENRDQGHNDEEEEGEDDEESIASRLRRTRRRRAPIPPHGSSLAYGGSPGNGDAYVAWHLGRRSVRDTWIAIWVLWLLWALLFFAKQTLGATRFTQMAAAPERPVAVAPVPSLAVGPENGPYTVDGATSLPGEETGAPTPASAMPGAPGTSTPVNVAGSARGSRGGSLFSRAVDSVRDRVVKTHNLVRDLTLMLLLVVSVNTFGLGSGVVILVLSWIYVAVVFLWACLLMLVENRIIDMILGSLQMVLLLAMLIAAYSIGWTVLS